MIDIKKTTTKRAIDGPFNRRLPEMLQIIESTLRKVQRQPKRVL